jgi:hypothetical protein
MMSKREVDDAEIARVSDGWLRYQAGEDATYEWALFEQDEWFTDRDYSAMERFVRRLCRDVEAGDEHGIGMIGAGPLEDLIVAFPERALDFVEAEGEVNPIVLQALAGVWLHDDSAVRARIDAILARKQQEDH